MDIESCSPIPCTFPTYPFFRMIWFPRAGDKLAEIIPMTQEYGSTSFSLTRNENTVTLDVTVDLEQFNVWAIIIYCTFQFNEDFTFGGVYPTIYTNAGTVLEDVEFEIIDDFSITQAVTKYQVYLPEVGPYFNLSQYNFDFINPNEYFINMISLNIWFEVSDQLNPMLLSRQRAIN
jgi:hypothetical protein